MERIKSLGRYQKRVLIIITVMVLIFTVIYPITISRKGFAYKGAILIPNQENGNVTYSGKIKGEQAIFFVYLDKTSALADKTFASVDKTSTSAEKTSTSAEKTSVSAEKTFMSTNKTSTSADKISVYEGKTVEFQYGDRFYGPYTAKEDPSAIPKGVDTVDTMTGVELRLGDNIFFRGGVDNNGDVRFLYNEDGSIEDILISTAADDAIESDANLNANTNTNTNANASANGNGNENGNENVNENGDASANGSVINPADPKNAKNAIVPSDPIDQIDPSDPIEPTVSVILDLMAGPELTHKGEWKAWIIGVFLCFITAISILFADNLFRWNLIFLIRNADQAVPSGWETLRRYIVWTLLPIMAMIIFIVGLK